MADINKIKAKLSSLLQRTVENGATEAEALEATIAALKLADRYGVSLADLEKDNAELELEERYADTPTGRMQPIDQHLGRPISDYCGTRIVVDFAAKRTSFYGFPADVELALFLRELHRVTMNNECKIYMKYVWANSVSTESQARQSFQVGYCARIAERLEAYTRAKEAVTTGTSLIVLKNQIVEKGYKVVHPNMHTASGPRMQKADGAAYGAGVSAGDAAPMGRATGHTKTTMLT